MQKDRHQGVLVAGGYGMETEGRTQLVHELASHRAAAGSSAVTHAGLISGACGFRYASTVIEPVSRCPNSYISFVRGIHFRPDSAYAGMESSMVISVIWMTPSPINKTSIRHHDVNSRHPQEDWHYKQNSSQSMANSFRYLIRI